MCVFLPSLVLEEITYTDALLLSSQLYLNFSHETIFQTFLLHEWKI